MHSNDERLRVAYRDSLTERARGQGDSHPEPEALLAVAERSGSEAVRLEVLDHVMTCESCRRELDLIRASVIAATEPRQRTWFRSPSIGLMAIAATLLVVAGVRLFVASGDSDAGPRLRGGAGISTYDVRWIPTAGAGLAWHPAQGAASYRLEVIDEAGVALVDSTIRDTTFLVAESLLKNRRGVTWSVTATLAGRSTVTSSPIRLVPPAP
jgi:hypothetical protein